MAYKGTASPQDIAEDFGQKVDLTRRIREILANYPEGTTVLKELIQNADDAGATEVSFCLDRRKHGADSMLYEGLSPWQGPAVLAFNNAEFSAQDFESISKLGGSKKGREPWKTGRFGVGFNSVYHLSDLPSFVSGRHIVYFDPHCKFLPNISSVNPGKRIDFVKSSALSYYKDQFTPYCMFGCDMKAHFQGTIFRFPLRTVRQAAESQLSKQHYKEENIIQLFDELCEEASLCMLFLKNVEVIRFYDWHPDNSSPFMLCSCSLTSLASQTRWQRHALTRLADSWTSFQGNASKLKYLESFILEFNTEKSFGNKCRETFTESFMIVQCMDTPISQVGILSSLAAKEYGVCLLPWVAVAAKISGTETQEDFFHKYAEGKIKKEMDGRSADDIDPHIRRPAALKECRGAAMKRLQHKQEECKRVHNGHLRAKQVTEGSLVLVFQIPPVPTKLASRWSDPYRVI